MLDFGGIGLSTLGRITSSLDENWDLDQNRGKYKTCFESSSFKTKQFLNRYFKVVFSTLWTWQVLLNYSFLKHMDLQKSIDIEI